MSRFSVTPMAPRSWGLGFVWDGRLKDLHVYLFNILITIDCYIERKRK